MEFLGHKLTMKRLETLAERGGGDIRTHTNLHRDTLAAARARPQAEMAAADEAERALEGSRRAIAEMRAANDAKRRRLRAVAHEAREAADDAPSRRAAREHDLAAAEAERDIAALDEDDRRAEAELGAQEIKVIAKRRLAHVVRALALQVWRDTLYADVQLEIHDANQAASNLEREMERRGVRPWNVE